MTTSSTSEASRQLTRSEWVSTLPPWRRLLAMLNWRPVYDIEQRTKQLREENRRLAELESRLDALSLNADSSSQTPPATGSNLTKRWPYCSRRAGGNVKPVAVPLKLMRLQGCIVKTLPALRVPGTAGSDSPYAGIGVVLGP
jgi:hypothetical protein